VRDHRWGRHSHRRVEVELTMPAGVGTVDLHTGHGRVETHGVTGRLHLKSGHGQAAVHAGNGVAEVSTGHGDLTIAGFEGRLEADSGHGRLHVERVQGVAELRTGHGPVQVIDSDGKLHVATGHGPFELIGVSGEVELRTGHGQVEVSAPRSLKLQLEAGMGGLRIAGGSVRGLDVRLAKGSLQCDTTLEPGRYDVQTGVGEVEVGLPENARARIEAQTSFGRVESDVPLVQVGRSGPMSFGGARMVGSVGEGEPEIELALRTGNGNVRIFAGEAGPAAAGWSRPPWRRPSRSAEGDSGAHSFRWERSRGGPPWARRMVEGIERDFARRRREWSGPAIADGIERRVEEVVERTVVPAVEQAAAAVERFVGGATRSLQNPMPPTSSSTAASASSSAPPSAGDATVRILEAVARGEITPQEADRLLNGDRRR
jgi:DUF4097 and DUF4098 domain-containing protein YvlB